MLCADCVRGHPGRPGCHHAPRRTRASRYLLATALLVLMFMAIITYGQWVATSVAEEKSSRVMELLITAATPRQLLLGKVMGAGGAGLIQYVAIVAAALGGLVLQGTISRPHPRRVQR